PERVEKTDDDAETECLERRRRPLGDHRFAQDNNEHQSREDDRHQQRNQHPRSLRAMGREGRMLHHPSSRTTDVPPGEIFAAVLTLRLGSGIWRLKLESNSSSFPRLREPRRRFAGLLNIWVPAFAGMTKKRAGT